MGVKIIFLFLGISLLSSCLKQSESITPIAKPQTLSELQKESLINTANEAGNSDLSTAAKASFETSSGSDVFYLNLKYNFQNIDVYAAAGLPNSFENIGQTFLASLAKVFLAITGSAQIDTTPISITIPDFALDLSIVKSIKIKNIFIQYNSVVDAKSDFLADFSFLDTLELAQEVNVPNVGLVDSLIFSYRKSNNKCLNKCLQFNVMTDDFLPLLKPNTTIKLKPRVIFTNLPKVYDLKLDGVIEMQIGLKLPF